MSQVIVDLLAEAGIEEALADKIVEAFEEKLQEGISTGVETQLESAKQEWALNQAGLVESALDTIIEQWGETNKSLLESAAQAEVVNEASEAIRKLLGVDTVAFNESVGQYADGKIGMLNGTVETLQNQLDEANTEKESLLDELTGYRRAEIFAEATDGLSDLACDKITEALSKQTFADEAEFGVMVKALAEAHRAPSTFEKQVDGAVDNAGTQDQFNEGTKAPAAADPAEQQKPISLAEATLLQMQGKKV